jgi:tyrosine decarboxylase/aspartate 1-decarboxylase
MKERTYKEILKILEDAKREDFNFSDGRVLGSMCTRPLDIAQVAHGMFLEANLGNPGLYPGTKKLENEVIRMQGELLHAPDAAGHVVGGGTESNITALWMARNMSKKKEVVFPKSAHFSIIKACDILDMKPVMVDLDDNYRMDVDTAAKRIGDDTAAVVGIAGTTELGVIDPIRELGEISNDVFFHVDAAFGGYVIPFLKDLGYDIPEFDFNVPRVSTMSIDAHKMGMATIPSGSILMRSKKYLEKIVFKSPYLTKEDQTSLLGTRCSAGAVSAYAAMKFLGREGYKKIVRDCMDVTDHAIRKSAGIGLEPVVKPLMNIVNLKLRNPAEVYKALDGLDWKTSTSKNPPALRLVIMPHVTKNIIDEFLDDLEKVCKKLGEL